VFAPGASPANGSTGARDLLDAYNFRCFTTPIARAAVFDLDS
jgi:hypothetical protein